MRFVFDFVIVFILILCVYWMYVIIRSFFSDQKRKVRTKIVRSLILVVLAVIAVLVFWGSFILPHQIVINRQEINLNKTEEHEQIKVVFVSDFHIGPYKQDNYVEAVVEKIKALEPDLILLGGDFIDYRWREERAVEFLAAMSQLNKIAPVLAVTGNHEYRQAYYSDDRFKDKTKVLRQRFEEWGIDFLDNEQQSLELAGKQVTVSGVFDIWTKMSNLEKVSQELNSELPNILLCHNPDVILNQESQKFDLILSGHTHAGQIRLPGIGAIASIPNILGRAYDQGLFFLDNKTQLLITAGLGETGTRARLFSHPEIVLIDLDL